MNDSNMVFYYEWRFREQDGDWSPWYPCTAAEAGMKSGRWDTEVRERSATR